MSRYPPVATPLVARTINLREFNKTITMPATNGMDHVNNGMESRLCVASFVSESEIDVD